MPQQKVHQGLDSIDRETTYHLGYYDLDFQDGSLRFQLHAKICGKPPCLCDNLQIDWLASGTVFNTWFTANRQWRDFHHQELHPDLLPVFRTVEGIATFQERYQHLVYLRRRQVLESLGRLEPPFEVQIPSELVPPSADPAKGILGEVHSRDEGAHPPFALEFCGDETCYCDNLFLVFHEKTGSRSFCIQSDDLWSTMDDSAESKRRLPKLRESLGQSPFFQRQLDFFRQERMLHNYFRFAHNYR